MEGRYHTGRAARIQYERASSLNEESEQRYILLTRVHIAIIEGTLDHGTRKRDLDGTEIRQGEDHYAGRIDSVEVPDHLGISDAGSAHSVKGRLVREKDVQGEPEWSGVLGTDLGRELPE
jgi:hypothetical protein